MFRDLIDALKFGRSHTAGQRARRDTVRRWPAPCRPAVEPFEDRCVPAAVLSIGGTAILAGNAGTQNALLTVRLSEPHPNNVTVNYRTADGTATAGSDSTAVSGKLTFAKNELTKTILVPVRGDRAVELDESFLVHLSSPTRGTNIAIGTGVITVVDDEPRISITDISGREGNAGTTAFTFTVSLSAASDKPVTVKYATADRSATAGSDYAAVAGSLTFQPGQPTSQTINVLVNGDRSIETDETFVVRLSDPSANAEISRGTGAGTILDDEPRISVADAYNYGDYSRFTFTVSLSAGSEEVVTVDFATADGTAVAGVDYVATLGALTFNPGETTQTITVAVLDPTASDKYFAVQRRGASANAVVQGGTAYGYW